MAAHRADFVLGGLGQLELVLVVLDDVLLLPVVHEVLEHGVALEEAREEEVVAVGLEELREEKQLTVYEVLIIRLFH